MSTPEFDDRLEGVAIIGMAGKFPGAPDLETFWANINAGRDTITHFSRAELEARDRASLEFDADYVAAHGILEDAEMFDAGFFAMPPREADFLDPQHRLFLEACHTALEDGGYDATQFPGRIGVFGGCSLNTYLLSNLSANRAFLDEIAGNYQVGEFQVALGNDKDFLCTRVAYKLNLRGPCFTVQSACATSLVAICQASQNLLTYQCDMALAGGVSVTFPQYRGYVNQEGSMGSSDGHCRPFDADASGTVFGHGVGVVLLKRYEDALADGDRIDAVIRGFAVNNDGAAKVSYMAPGVEGQTAAVAAAQAMAAIDADAITYVEAHGTATPLGDPVEVAALTRAFRLSTNRNNFCALGSTKANIGHLDAAAGVSGLIKTVLAMRHRTIPPVANFKQPNPRIDFASTPFYVNREAMPWQSAGPRMAGVSAFGVGGVNAHVVLEEGPARVADPPRRSAQLLCVSTRSEAALDAALGNLGRHLREHPELNLADAAYTLQTGRNGFEHRASLVCSSMNEAIQDLEEKRRIHRSQSILARPQVAFLFTGQGSQFPGMGRALYQTEPVYRSEIDACAEILTPLLDLDLRTLIFPEESNLEASAEALMQTRLAQPALFITELAMAKVWMEWGIAPQAMTGHSLGEFSAAVVAGVMSREDGLRLVAARGRLMQQMERGAMLSVRLGGEQVAALLNERLSIAGMNSPSLCTVSGPFEAIEALEKRLERDSVGFARLRTSHAFHSAMMDPMLDAFEAEAGKVALHPPLIPYVSGVTGKWITAEEATDPRYWREHCRKPVRFADAAAALLDLPGAVLLEVGPGQALTTLALQQRGNRATPIVASMPERAVEAIASGTMHEALGRLWTAGIQPEWKHFWGKEHRQHIALPTYPFERKKHWIDPPKYESPANGLLQVVVSPQTDETQNIGESSMGTAANGSVAERRLRLQPIVASLFEELSGIATGPESVDTSFMELGFDSLFLTQATQAVQRRFGVKVTFRQIIEQYSSIGALADRLDEMLPAEAFPAEQAQLSQPVPVVAATPTVSATPAAAAAGSPLETLFAAQMQAMSQLFQQQLAAIHGTAPIVAPAYVSAPIPSPVAEKAVAPIEAAPTAQSGAIKPHGPFKPVQPGTRDGVTEEQRQFIQSLIARYTQRTGKSKEYTARHRPHLADPRAVSGFRSLWKEIVYPLVSSRSKGSRIWDLDGNEYIDIVNGFGAIMFGHGPEFVTEAVHKQIDQGVEIGPQSSLAGEVAALICELTGMERAAFCNTGSEAVIAAIRVARAVTARDKIVYFTGDYHGTFDEALLRATPNGAQPIAPGIMAGNPSNVVVLEYGADASLQYIQAHGDEIAAVLVEPIQSRHPEVQPRAFLQELRTITEQNGTALIFDEVVTGFRVTQGGAQEYYGIRADLATYGKVIGGGYPIGVVAGKAKYLDTLDGGAWQYGDDSAPEVGMTFFAGTFVRHPLAMAAAKAVLLHLKQAGPALQETLSRKVAKAAHEVEACFRDAGLDIGVHPCGAWFTFSLPSEVRYGSLLFFLMREKGVHILENYACFFTTAHSDEDFARIVECFRQSIQEMRQGGMLPLPATEPVHALPETANVSSAVPEFHPAARREAQDTAPMTESQREIWLGAGRGDEVNCAFNESLTLCLRGTANQEEILRALEAAINRHDALRSTVDPDQECMKIAPAFIGQIPYVDLSALSAEDCRAFIDARIADEGRTPFDLSQGPLIRAMLFRTAPDELLLLLTGHHIVLDGWSANQLLEDMGRIYNASRSKSKPVLAPLMPFSSYALKEQEEAKAGAYAENEHYWVELFAGRAPVLDLPTDRPRPIMKTYNGSTLRVSLGAELTAEVKKASSRLGCTLYVTLLSAYQILLHRLTRQSELVVGISAAGQALFEDASLVGHCVHFLPMLSVLPQGCRVKEHLVATRGQLLEAYDHQEFTYGTLLRKLPIQRDSSRLPLIEVQFNLEKSGAAVHFDGLRSEMKPNPKAFVNTDLFLNIVEAGDDLLLNCDYNTDLIDRSSLERWLASYAVLLHGMAADSSKEVEALEVLEAAERCLVVDEWNRTATNFGPFEPIYHTIERLAAQTPNRIAVVCHGIEWSYQKLNEYSNRLARYMRRQGIREGSLVGVCVERSHEMLGAVLAVLKTGAAYLPLDPSYPASRLEMVLADAEVTLLLTQEHLGERLCASARVVCLDSEQTLWAKESNADLEIAIQPGSLAYVIYTSGSTGRPKGVAIEHGALNNLLRSMEREPGLTANDTLVAVTTLSFDIAALELFLPLIVGARLVIARREEVLDGFGLLRLLEHSGATVVQATPAGWRILLEAGWKGQPQLKVLCGGEALPRDLADSLLALSDEVWNVYGPTETTIWSSATRLEKRAGPVCIGPPIANTQFYVLDARLQPVPVGVTGELYIGGAGLARGYWHRPELTAEKFVSNPIAGGRIYRTGDEARWLPNGLIELLGRTDFQVKVRGFRIELGEIESVLASHPAVRDAVATAVEVAPGDKRLAAWVDLTLPEPPADLDGQLRALLSDRLPEYMRPAVITVLAALPRTANGKIDRKSFPAPSFVGKTEERKFTPPETPEQKKLAAIWADILHLDQVSITDSIFELGADSLLIFRISARAGREGLPVQPAEIFQHRTIANLSKVLGVTKAVSREQIPAVSRENYRRKSV